MTLLNPRYVSPEGVINCDSADGVVAALPGSVLHELIAGGALGEIAPYVEPQPPTEAELLAAWRKTARADRRSFSLACGLKPWAEGSATTLWEVLVEHFEALPLSNLDRGAFFDVADFQRLGRDALVVQAASGLIEAEFDDLFAAAMDIQAGGDGWAEVREPSEFI